MYIIKSLNVYNLFWKTTHPEPSLPLSLSLLSWAFKYSSTAYQSSHQKQAFHKPAGIIQMKKLSAQLHRHYNKCFTGPTLGPSTWLTLTFFSFSILFFFQTNSSPMFTLSPKAPFLLTLIWYVYDHSQNSYLCQQSHQTSIFLVLSILLMLVSCLQHPMKKYRSKRLLCSSGYRLSRSVRWRWDALGFMVFCYNA